MTSQVSYKQREFGGNGKVTSTTVFAADLTALNIDAQETAVTDFVAAVGAVSLGESRGIVYQHEIDPGNADFPADEQAQRENKWLVSCREDGGGLNAVTFTIPCANLEFLGLDGENMETGAERSALITAIETLVLSNDGVPVVVESIKFRARSR